MMHLQAGDKENVFFFFFLARVVLEITEKQLNDSFYALMKHIYPDGNHLFQDGPTPSAVYQRTPNGLKEIKMMVFAITSFQHILTPMVERLHSILCCHNQCSNKGNGF